MLRENRQSTLEIAMTYTGHVQNGQLVFDGPAPPEGASFRLELVSAAISEEKPAITFAERYASVIGKAENLPADAASNVDHYLYGHPKK